VTLITSQRVAATLDLPLRQHNALLVAAGFAPIWRETEFGAPELKEVRRALDYILSQQEPFPAAAVDRRWSLLQANEGAVRLVEFLVGPLAPGAKINLADALVAPDVLRPYLTNWPDGGQPDRRGPARQPARRRADHAESDRRAPRRLCRHLGWRRRRSGKPSLVFNEKPWVETGRLPTGSAVA
jgi:MmyB-like transcription regulator ligand binding domain